MNSIKTCLYCNKALQGRADKKYCNSYCKSAHQYKRNKNNEVSFYEKVDKQLKTNRRILKEYNKAGKATVRKEILLKEGFDPRFFTHYWKNTRGQVYLFCYEFGFLHLKEHDSKEKYILVKWQVYMS